jgi:hypothetical protein
MIIFAIETSAGADRQYLAGSPFVDAAVWSREEAPAFARQSQTRTDGDRCSDTLDHYEEGQAAIPTAFTSRRLYDNAQLAQQALATLPAAHRWGGTAVALIESTTAHLWHVFKGADAVLSMMEAKRTGCEVLISYSFSLGAWVEQETLFDDAA